MKQKGLGRGLSALIPEEEGGPEAGFFLCPVDEIRPNPYQMRRHPDNERLAGLAASIAEKGLLEPIVVRKPQAGAGYELIAGERRWRAAIMAGLKAVPALVRDAGDGESLELALIENIQREDLNPIEEALAYRRLAEEFGLSQADIARRTGKDRSTVANAMRLLKLPAPIQEAIQSGKLSAGHARAILALPAGEQLAAAEAILAGGLTVREAEGLTKRRPRAPKRAAPEPDPDLAAAAHGLMTYLGTKVRLVPRGQGGRIEIDYYSPGDLARLLERITT